MGKKIRIILGSGRSGTTWMQDVLAEANQLRPIFEPLKSVSKRVPDYEYAFLDASSDVPDLETFLSKAFNGNFNSIWSDYRLWPSHVMPGISKFTSVQQLMAYRRHLIRFKQSYLKYRRLIRHEGVIVKLIRANLMMEWLRIKFDPNMILVIRHPGAVVESQLRLGGESWDPHLRLNYYKNDSKFMSTLGPRYSEHLNRSEQLTPAEINTLIWIIENQYPLEQACKQKCNVFYYEQIVVDPYNQWPKILESLALEHLPSEEILAQPSQQSALHWKLGKSTFNKLSTWMNQLSQKDRNNMDSLLQEYGVTIYCMEHDQPLV